MLFAPPPHPPQDRHAASVRLFLHYGDLSDTSNLVSIIRQAQPDEIYNLAAQSHVKVSFEMPEYTGDIDALGTLRLLEAMRICGIEKSCRFYQVSSSVSSCAPPCVAFFCFHRMCLFGRLVQDLSIFRSFRSSSTPQASTSELYGKVRETPQSEETPFYPRSPYAVAKQFAFWTVVNYREAYGIHASNGILFNHESPRRGPTFVTRKTTRAVARIAKGVQDCLYLGNLDAQRDWGHAKDYVHAMWMMLQVEQPDDYVVATGETHSVREFVTKAFKVAGIAVEWRGEGLEEIGVDMATGKEVVRVDPKYFRPTEVDLLLGNPAKAKAKLGWELKVTFDELVREMVEYDMEECEKSNLKW